MNKQTRKKYYNLCNPIKFQPLDSGLILDIDNYEIGGKKVNARGKVWAEDIADKISWSDEPQVVYFTGYTGSGKTTELKRALRILEDKDDANLFPIYINSLDFFDLHSKIELIDIYSVIVYNVTLEVARYMGKDESTAFSESGFFTRTWRWLNDTDVTLKSAEIENTSPAKLIFEMKERPDFRRKVKENINSDISRFKKDVLVELDRLNKLVKNYENNKQRKNGIVLVLDSLEKNRGIGEDIDLVAESTERLFKDKESLTLPFHTIYTIPAYLSTLHISDIFFLPVVRVLTKEDEIFDNGIEVMKALVHDRIPKEELDTIIDDEMLKELVLFSGGYPRDLLKMLQKVLQTKEFPIQKKDIDTIFLDLENEYQEFVPRDFRKKLIVIHETKKLDINEYEQRKIAYELFSIHAILRYRNGNLWYGLHPALQKVLKIEKSDG